MSQVHNKTSFYARGVCKSMNNLNSLPVILNNDQKEVFVNQKRGVINLYYKSSRTRTRWQYNNFSNTVNARAAGWKPTRRNLKHWSCCEGAPAVASPQDDPGGFSRLLNVISCLWRLPDSAVVLPVHFQLWRWRKRAEPRSTAKRVCRITHIPFCEVTESECSCKVRFAAP